MMRRPLIWLHFGLINLSNLSLDVVYYLKLFRNVSSYLQEAVRLFHREGSINLEGY